jgi:hypothetical protein
MRWMSLMMIFCRMAVKRMRMLGVDVRKKALTVNRETVTLIGKGR